MYIEPLFRHSIGLETFAPATATRLILPASFPAERADYIRAALSHRHAPAGAPMREIRFTLSKISADRLPGFTGKTGHAEECALFLGEDTELTAPTEAGLLFGFGMLLQLLDEGENTVSIVYSCPNYPIRGHRAYLPARRDLDAFYRYVDMMAYCQNNVLMLEIGGAMEYRRHPEINAAWRKILAMSKLHPEENGGWMWRTFPWIKDGRHPANGGGDILTQEECRALAAYCEARGLQIMPEVPTLSHCDYLVESHPEIAERDYDPYPDTYCPNHPATYPLVFDVLEEVIEVFHPKTINIGHDECYTVGICPRCRDKAPGTLYAEDVTRLHDFLSARGVDTAMWGEKLFPTYYRGEPLGGCEILRKDKNGKVVVASPKLYDCVDKIPRNVLMMHWYSRFDPKNDEVFHEYGYPMIFGNSELYALEECDRRLPKSRGAITSNWQTWAPEHMRRDFNIFNIFYDSRALSSHDFTGTDTTRYSDIDRTMAAAYLYFAKRKGENYIEVVHTTKTFLPLRGIYTAIDPEADFLGEYELTYEDGLLFRLPVCYGTHLSCALKEGRTATIIGDTMHTEDAAYHLSGLYRELCGEALPEECGGLLWYRTRYTNPHPGHTVTSYRYLAKRPEVEVLTDTLCTLPHSRLF